MSIYNLSSVRRFWVVVHRWSGLTIAAFLAIAGLTGAVLPWADQLTALVTPAALIDAAPPTPGARPLPGPLLAAEVQRRTGGFAYAPLDDDGRRAVTMFVSARPGRPPLGYDQVIVDPYTGAIRAAYTWGDPSAGWQNMVPFLFSLHYGVVAGEWGRWTWGVAALIWTLDCFVGFYLTLPIVRGPAAGERRAASGWWRRWRPAWLVRRRARGHKLHFDLHRAGGLWLWPLLLVFAWSSVAFNLPQAHDPVMRLFGASPAVAPPTRATPLDDPALGPVAAVAAGERQVRALAARRGFALVRSTSLDYQPAAGVYRLRMMTSLGNGGGATAWIDGAHGRLMRFDPPGGRDLPGRVDDLFAQLHYATIGGLPYRIFVSLLGLTVAGLSVTGVLLWARRRSARLLSRRRPPPSPLRPVGDFPASSGADVDVSAGASLQARSGGLHRLSSQDG